MYRADYWTEKLNELERRVTAVQRVDLDERYAWAAECISTFAHLGVPSDIIRGFMNIFENESGGVMKTQWVALLEQWENPARQADRIKGFFYPRVAFETARMLIKKIEEEERLVPKSLVELFKNKPAYTHLGDSLESMESSYQAKNIEALLSSSGSLLWSVINLHSDDKLQKLNRRFKDQMDYLTKNTSVLDDFGVDKELVEIMHNFRYLRNNLSQHKKKAIPKPPLSVGYGFAYLVILFLIGTLNKGVLIK